METLAYALMGIGDFVGMRWLVFDDRPTVPPRAVATISQLVDRALANDVTSPARCSLSSASGWVSVVVRLAAVFLPFVNGDGPLRRRVV